ncbi:flagellar biosynthesis protein [Clostridium botulinum]|uniref:Flagellar biosynthesis protein n=1 Tax=Clostridium botulinum C/D str. DC5 TaxID=1443128 RepID=A0A0A0IMK3_CLOBO|nr:TIGR02530 family flagellar biosynthesis protein [Clostridium botulinum]KEI02081.1 flagellar biosynthesis protein [Clostridium botulinum C/D str. BKT75002]KEI09495.1 flagellar biosynthesis protein [Clostridium botulinum C/D str. BKT2873]KGN01859.1 flagellar biosynthesis protein [Clostridium botulinum C/D str. DC5]KOC55693.1 flagellar biosynthesis protein [Clostridium botulinum]KOC57600.1 flagellar biosynthesis protein [Clostridium botulinum]
MGYRIINGNLYPVGSFPEATLGKKEVNKKQTDSFGQLLKNEINKESNNNVDFKISNHAVKRLQDRNIMLSQKDMENINKGINMAKEKGAKDSVIIYKNIALITNIKNRTIITAVDKETSKENVFTNIDSVVLL